LPPVKTTIVLMWASTRIIIMVFLKIGPYVMYYTCNGSDTICDVPALKKDG
jgi:hypothetical protein